MRKSRLNTPLFILYIACFLTAMSSVGATYISPGKLYIEFEPNFEQTYMFRVGAASSGEIEVKVAGDLAKYAKIGEIKRYANGDMEFPVHIKLPAKIDNPGPNKIKVSANEIPRGGPGFSTSVNVIAPITIFVPYPGIFIQAGLQVNNVNVNDTVDYDFTIHNFGYENVSGVYAQIDLYGRENNFSNKLMTLYSEPTIIYGNTQNQKIHLYMNSTGYKPGKYKASGTVYYKEEKKEMDYFFNIGTLIVYVLNYTREFKKDTINPFQVNVENGWNNDIINLYAIVTINGTSFQTPSVSLSPFEIKTIIGYWDTTGLEYGEYPVQIELHYNGQTNTEYGTVWIPEPPKKKWFEQPISLTFSTTTLLIIIIIILVLVDFIWVIVRKKKKKKPKKKGKGA